MPLKETTIDVAPTANDQEEDEEGEEKEEPVGDITVSALETHIRIMHPRAPDTKPFGICARIGSYHC